MSRSDLQFDFPRFARPEPPDWLLHLFQVLKSLLPALKDVFWVVLAIGIVALLAFAGRAAWQRLRRARGRDGAAPSEAEAWRPAPHAARMLLREADALAARGEFGEATHLLLLRGIEDIADRRPSLLKPALTSREIGRLDQIPFAARAAFARIAEVVERAIFAGRTVSAAEFSRCRQEYEDFALPSAWRAEALQ